MRNGFEKSKSKIQARIFAHAQRIGFLLLKRLFKWKTGNWYPLFERNYGHEDY